MSYYEFSRASMQVNPLKACKIVNFIADFILKSRETSIKYYDNRKIAKGYENANLRKFEKGEKRSF